MSEAFQAKGYSIPQRIRYACSWPAGQRGGKRILGQCVAPQASADGSTEVYVVPTLDKPDMVLGVLMHELVHAAVGVEAGHGPAFKQACSKLGLEGPARQALPGAKLKAWLADIAAALGPYPHGAVNLDARKKQGTRMLKAVCPETGYTVRLSKKWAEMGLPISPAGYEMQLVDDNEE